jgi:hypothetical protein
VPTSEPLLDPGLFQDRVRGVARLDFSVHNETALGDGTEPDLMVTLTLPLETATAGQQELLDLRGKR